MKWCIAFRSIFNKKWYYCLLPPYNNLNQAHRVMNNRRIGSIYTYCIVEENTDLKTLSF